MDVNAKNSHLNFSQDSTTQLQDAFVSAESQMMSVIAGLHDRLSLQDSDQYECAAIASEAEKIVDRWRNTATVAVDGLNSVDQEIENEIRRHAEMERLLALKEQKLAKMWADSKVIKAAISILDAKSGDSEGAHDD